MKFNLTDVFNLIKERRTIGPGKYKDRAVHKEQIEKMLEAANWAPTHGLTEPWRFKVFSGEGLKNLLQFQADFYKKNTPADSFLQSKYDGIINRADKATYVIAICMKRQETERIPEIEEVMATAAAVQNMALMATAYGMGTLWSTGFGVLSNDMKTYLGLGEKDKCLGTLYVGYPEGEWPEGKRNIWMNKVEWIEE